MNYIGIDVAGLKKQQVIAVLDNDFGVKILLEKIKKRDDVAKLSKRIYGDYGENSIVAIDSPRCWSIGPKNIRKCEKEIRQYIKTNLINTPIKSNYNKKQHEWMQVGMWFFEAFGNNRPNVIEVFPSASYALLNNSKISFKLPISQINKSYKKDTLDAICAAITGYYYHINKYQKYGDEEEGYIIVPKI